MKNAPEKNTMNPMDIPAPAEDCWGFYGTILDNGKITPDNAACIWKTACQALAETYNETDAAVIRNFLRSRYGRHLADSVHEHAYRITDGDSIETIYEKAVTDALTPAKNWRREFKAIRKTTLSGEWED